MIWQKKTHATRLTQPGSTDMPVHVFDQTNGVLAGSEAAAHTSTDMDPAERERQRATVGNISMQAGIYTGF